MVSCLFLKPLHGKYVQLVLIQHSSRQSFSNDFMKSPQIIKLNNSETSDVIKSHLFQRKAVNDQAIILFFGGEDKVRLWLCCLKQFP